MKKFWLYLSLAALMLLGGAALIWQGLQKSIVLQVDGAAQTIHTRRLAVAGLLAEAGIVLAEADRLSPELDTRLRAGMDVVIERAIPVVVEADGQTQVLLSAERLPENLLAEARVALYPGDQLLVDGRLADMLAENEAALLEPGQPHSLQVRRAHQINLVGDEERQTLNQNAASLGQGLWAAGIRLYEADQTSLPLESSLPVDADIAIQSSRMLQVETSQGAQFIRSAAKTTGDALAEAGLALQHLDYSIPDAGESLPEDGNIRIVRVLEEVAIEQTPLPFETQYQPNPDDPLDTQRILETGSYGIQARRVRVRYEDGVEVSREVETEWLAIEPTARLVSYGTKVVPLTLNTPGGQITYWRAVSMYATSYSPCRLGIPNYCNDVTYSGAILQKGIAAVTRTMYGLIGGSTVYVPGYGTARIADVGSGVFGQNWIDLGYSDADFTSWGKTVTVYFLWPPPADISWVLP